MEHHNHDHHADHNHSEHADHSATGTTTITTSSTPVTHLHDHSAHGGNMNHNSHQMMMYFHGGNSEIILFNCWKINSFSGLYFSCVLIFFMAAAYEGIKWFRVYYQMFCTAYKSQAKGASIVSLNDFSSGRGIEDALLQNASNPKCPLQTSSGTSSRNVGTLSNDQVYVPTVVMADKNKSMSKLERIRNCTHTYALKTSSYFRVIEAVLYGFQLVLAYFLMLIAMTYNVYLFGSVVLGATFGHWLFAGFKCVLPPSVTLSPEANVDNFASDACH